MMPKLNLESPHDNSKEAVAAEAMAYFKAELASIEARAKKGESGADPARNEERVVTIQGILKDLEDKNLGFAVMELQEETRTQNEHPQDPPENEAKLNLLKKLKEVEAGN